jgi:hypothetical protein
MMIFRRLEAKVHRVKRSRPTVMDTDGRMFRAIGSTPPTKADRRRKV